MSVARPTPSVVVVGGGHGCSRSLRALRRLEVERTAVVTVADDGGSSGRLRRDHDVVALGDLRMALLALAGDAASPGETAPDGTAPDTSTFVALAGRRFERGELAGHSLGNLLLLGLIEESGGDLIVALDAFARLVGAVGRVLPATIVPVTLAAETASGPVAGQVAVATATRIRSVRLDPDDAPAAPGVLDALSAADLILLGPGSLYTSILPNLLVGGAADTLRDTSARVVLVGNLRAQPGETEGMDLADHVEALLQHVPGLRLDVLLVHERSGRDGRSDRRDRGEGAPAARDPLRIDEQRLAGLVGTIVRTDLGEERDGHDPQRLAVAVADLLGLAGGPVA